VIHFGVAMFYLPWDEPSPEDASIADHLLMGDLSARE
jgi:hypothetical protein